MTRAELEKWIEQLPEAMQARGQEMLAKAMDESQHRASIEAVEAKARRDKEMFHAVGVISQEDKLAFRHYVERLHGPIWAILANQDELQAELLAFVALKDTVH